MVSIAVSRLCCTDRPKVFVAPWSELCLLQDVQLSSSYCQPYVIKPDDAYVFQQDDESARIVHG